MSFRAWFRPPRHLLPVFLLVTLAPSILLVVFGWRSIEQDEALQLRQAELRREQVADLAVAALEQNVSAIEQALRDPTAARGLGKAPDALALVFTAGPPTGDETPGSASQGGKEGSGVGGGSPSEWTPAYTPGSSFLAGPSNPDGPAARIETIPTAVPEPSTLSLAGIGTAITALVRRRQR